jgi:hypothetical protein
MHMHVQLKLDKLCYCVDLIVQSFFGHYILSLGEIYRML